ncbi:MAG: DJ-1/PfpI family protein [Nitrosomonadales bacterium]|nr:DJ-1/PfpI family protein [Nitrosomonadales bacterium]
MMRTIVFLLYPDFQLLDAAGPIAAFEMASRLRPGAYRIVLASQHGGRIVSSAGIELDTSDIEKIAGIDTLLVAGGDGAQASAADAGMTELISQCAARTRRIASVCTGAYLLAAAGLLKGKKATTHWRSSADFSRRFADVLLDADRIYVKDGHVWTAAGISAGIDLSLALIEEDLGEQIARQVAQQLVVYYRRPGGQSQHSALLEMSGGRFTGLLDYIRTNLSKPLQVSDLADRVCMSPRHFARMFMQETGMTPARAVERLRVEAASAILQNSGGAMQVVAHQCGFSNAEQMRRAFLRCKGVSALFLKQSRPSGKTAQRRGVG